MNYIKKYLEIKIQITQPDNEFVSEVRVVQTVEFNGKKYRVIEQGDDLWMNRVAQLALITMDLGQCVHCTRPYIKGYCCTTCGSTAPYNKNCLDVINPETLRV